MLFFWLKYIFIVVIFLLKKKNNVMKKLNIICKSVKNYWIELDVGSWKDYLIII